MAETQFWIGIHAAIVHEGRMLVLRRAPRMTYRPGSWDLPGGHLALGETIEQCLLREIAEETGLGVELGPALGLNTAPERPYVQIIYACRLTGPREVRLQPTEHVDSRWVTVEEMRGLGDLIPYLEAVLRRGMLDDLPIILRT